MSKLVWDQSGEKLYETGVEQVVLFPMNSDGTTYGTGVAWNGVTAININPSGAEPTALYANNSKYLSIMSAEEIAGTIEAYTYPDEWMECDGSKEVVAGVHIGQQPRKAFAIAFKTLIGNDTDFNKHGYKLHIIYNAIASVSEKAYSSVNDSPEVDPFSWEFTTTPVDIHFEGYEPTAYICIDSTKCGLPDRLKALEDCIYGNNSMGSNILPPSTIIGMFGFDA